MSAPLWKVLAIGAPKLQSMFEWIGLARLTEVACCNQYSNAPTPPYRQNDAPVHGIVDASLLDKPSIPREAINLRLAGRTVLGRSK